MHKHEFWGEDLPADPTGEPREDPHSRCAASGYPCVPGAPCPGDPEITCDGECSEYGHLRTEPDDFYAGVDHAYDLAQDRALGCPF